MGWLHEAYPKHEGYLIGYVEREGVTPGGGKDGLLRECMYPKDDADRAVVAISAGCDCGWRSPRWTPDEPATWFPYTVEVGARDEERGRVAWRHHLEEADEHVFLARLDSIRADWDRSRPNVIPLRRPPAHAEGRLELRQEASGPRHFLAGRPVHAGQTLELRVAQGVCRHAFAAAADEAREGVWLRGRYEWNFVVTPHAVAMPRFYIELGDTRGACGGLAECPLPTDAVLRWPSEG